MIEDTYQNALLAAAAYIDFNGAKGTISSQLETRFLALGLSQQEFSEFRDLYLIRAQFTPTGNGFSATIFEHSTTHKLTLAFRGTEAGDGNTDLGDLYQNLLIALGLSITAGEVGISQTGAIDTFLLDNDLIDSNGNAISVYDVNFTGHSLGGHLAMVTAHKYPLLIDQGYSFNGAGFRDPTISFAFTHLDTLWSEIIYPYINNTTLNQDRFHNYFGEAGPEIVASNILFDRPGTREGIAIEDHGPIENHGIKHLVDSLGLYRIFALLDPRLDSLENFVTLTKIVESLSYKKTGFIEDSLGQLEELFRLSSTSGDPETIYAALETAGINSKFETLFDKNASDLLAIAAADDSQTSTGYRYALANLTPFALTSNLSGTAADNPKYNLSNMSQQYLADRAYMLSTLLVMNESNTDHGNLPEPTKFTDLELNVGFDGDSKGYLPLVGSTLPAEHYDPDRIRISFGSNESDTSGNINLQTSENDDHLYGLGGADIINGLGGDDYIEGGLGNDELLGGDGIDTVRGGEGNDLITGGKGDDYLYGGAGADTFYWNEGDGSDAIADYDDGGDRIFVNGLDLSTVNFEQASSTSPFYSDSNHPGLTAHFDGTRLSILTGTGSDTGQITLQQYIPITGADYGIALNSYTPTQLVAADVTVHLVGKGDTEIDWIAWWRHYRHQGQVDWASSTINLDVAAIPNYAGTTENPLFMGPLFEGGPLGDQLIGDNLNNILLGVSGNDLIRGLDGFDILEGWKGSDIIEGGAGTDLIYGNTRINRVQSSNHNDEAQTFLIPHIGDEPGDINILDGGDGQDFVIGGEYHDIISGGEGDDYLWGGTGEDHISGGSGVDRILGDSSMLHVFTEGEDREVNIKAHTAFADGSDNVNQYDDLILGGEGNDTIWGELGDDEIHGDAGDDLLFGDRTLDPTFEVSPHLPYDTTNPDLSISLHGNDSLYGGTGDDRLVGQGGDDLLAGGPGLDGLWGGKGNDAYLIENGDGRNEIFDNEGRHTLVFSGIAPGAIDVIFSGDTVYIGGSEDKFAISRNEWENTSIALNSRENLIERSQLDTYYQDISGNLLLYVAGQRGITEAERNQIVAIDDSNRGHPRLVVGPNAGSFNASASSSDANLSITGSDLTLAVNIIMAGAAENIDFNDISLSLAPHIIVNLTTGSSNFPGTDNDDHIVGNNADSQLHSGGGNDILDGRGGVDTLYGQAGDDTLLGGDGDDILDGGSGDDVLEGGAGNDQLRASLGNDRLSGGTGDDVLGSGNGYTYLFSSGDGNDVIEIDNAGGGYTKGTLEFSSDINFNSISLSTVGVDTIIDYGNGNTLTLDMSTVLTSSDNAISRFTLTSAGNPAAVPLITETGPANNLLGTFGTDHIIGGNSAGLILPGYGDDIIETSVNGSWVRLNDLYFKDAEGGIGHKEIHMRGAYDQVTTPVHQGISYFFTSPDHYNIIEYDWSYTTVNPYDIELSGETAIFNAHGEDMLFFAEGIEYEELTFTRAGQDLEITMGASTGELRIKQFFVAYDVDISGQQIDMPLVAADTYIPGLLTKDYVLAAMPKTPISSLHFANGMEYDLANVLADRLITVPTLPGLTQIGTSRDDVIYGAANDNDVIQSREGHDVIDDDGGTNVIDTGVGDDTVTATGNNTVYAGSGNDLVNLTGGDNFVDGGEGNDQITASGDSFVLGGAGNDIIELTTGTHHVEAGPGDDQITISGGHSKLDTGDGMDFISLIGGSHILAFGSSQGIKGLGTAAGSNASVIVEMSPDINPEDITIVKVESESGPYISIALTNGSSALISAVLDPHTLQSIEGSALSAIHFADGTIWSALDILNITSPGEIEFIIGTEDSEILAGTSGRDDIKGFGGNDELRGGAGDDQLTGGAGHDILLGESGNDLFFVYGTSEGYDHVVGGPGFDTLQGGELNDLFGLTQLDVSDGLERIDGAGGVFNIVGGNDDDNILDFSATELINILAIAGGGGNDTIIGTQTADRIVGQDGDDTITGGSGNDILQGGSGDDVFLVTGIATGFDDVNGGAGLDTIRGGQENDLIGLSGLTPEHALEYIDGGGGVFNIVGGNDNDNTLDFSATGLINVLAIAGGGGNDTIVGTQEADRIVGQDGDDTITGGSGDDILHGGSGDDVFLVVDMGSDFDDVHGGTGFDTLRGGQGNSFIRLSGLSPDHELERINGGGGVFNIIGGNDEDNTLDFSATELINIIAAIGGGGHDQLIGSQGDDRLLGNEGNDTLAGSLGNDILAGGTGNDTYLFALGDGHDTILNGGTDSLAKDTLHLSGIEHDKLWLTRQGVDLLVSYAGSDDQVTVKDWYRADEAQLDDIYTESHVLQRNQVDQLVNAMASFDIPAGAGAIIPEDTRLQLEPMITSVWQAA